MVKFVFEKLLKKLLIDKYNLKLATKKKKQNEKQMSNKYIFTDELSLEIE